MIKKDKINVLVACEMSDQVRGRFNDIFFNAWSCDIQENEKQSIKHYKGDVRDILYLDWDAVIAFPPCNDLAVSGARYFEEKRKSGIQKKSIDFFMLFTKLKVPFVAIENPVGIMSTIYRKPDQIIQPYFFGDEARKTTCLWLKGFSMLKHKKENHVNMGKIINGYPAWMFNNNKNFRSKTFPGIAKAMVETWSKDLMINRLPFACK